MTSTADNIEYSNSNLSSTSTTETTTVTTANNNMMNTDTYKKIAEVIVGLLMHLYHLPYTTSIDELVGFQLLELRSQGVRWKTSRPTRASRLWKKRDAEGYFFFLPHRNCPYSSYSSL